MRASPLIFVWAILGTSCGTDSPSSPPDNAPEPDLILVVGIDGALPLAGSHLFTATVYANGAVMSPQPTLHWWSSDTSIATVDTVGVVYGRAPGSAMIYASAGMISAPSRVSVDRFGVLEVLEGRFATGFETSVFVPCGVNEAWWILGVPDGVRQYMSGKPEFKDPWGTGQPSGTVYVRWSIRKSGIGRYGHMGGHVREAEPQHLLLVRDTATTDCR